MTNIAISQWLQVQGDESVLIVDINDDTAQSNPKLTKALAAAFEAALHLGIRQLKKYLNIFYFVNSYFLTYIIHKCESEFVC